MSWYQLSRRYGIVALKVSLKKLLEKLNSQIYYKLERNCTFYSDESAKEVFKKPNLPKRKFFGKAKGY